MPDPTCPTHPAAPATLPAPTAARAEAWRPVPCPATSYHDREIHFARYCPEEGLWTCPRCGLGGTSEGFLHLVDLAIERFDLATGGGFQDG